MTFDELEPNVIGFEVRNERGFERLHVDEQQEPAPCAVCKTPTRWANIAMECPCCSKECVDEMWKAYFSRLEESLKLEHQLEMNGVEQGKALLMVSGQGEPTSAGETVH